MKHFTTELGEFIAVPLPTMESVKSFAPYLKFSIDDVMFGDPFTTATGTSLINFYLRNKGPQHLYNVVLSRSNERHEIIGLTSDIFKG